MDTVYVRANAWTMGLAPGQFGSFLLTPQVRNAIRTRLLTLISTTSGGGPVVTPPPYTPPTPAVLDLASLTDVAITSPAVGNLLGFDGAEWRNVVRADPAPVDLAPLTGRLDVLEGFDFPTMIDDVADDVTALQATVAGIVVQGGLIGQHNVVGADITNSTTDVRFDNYAAIPAVTLVPGDRILFNQSFNLINQTGAAANIASLKFKTNGINIFQWNSIVLPNAAGAVMHCNLFAEVVVGTDSLHHLQAATLTIGAPNSSQAGVGGANTATSATQSGAPVGIWPMSYASSSTDIGNTMPQIETRFAWATASASLTARPLQSTLHLLRAT